MPPRAVLAPKEGDDLSGCDIASKPPDINIAKENQTITFPKIPKHHLGDPDFKVKPTATSGLPVKVTHVSGPCTVSKKNVVHLTGTGTCKLKASQSGNANFNAGTPVTRGFLIV